MNVSQKAFEMMKLDMTKELIVMLMEEGNMEMETAMNVLYLSETYEKMSNPNTGLYYQSPGYVYSILDMELKNGKLEGLN